MLKQNYNFKLTNVRVELQICSASSGKAKFVIRPKSGAILIVCKWVSFNLILNFYWMGALPNRRELKSIYISYYFMITWHKVCKNNIVKKLTIGLPVPYRYLIAFYQLISPKTFFKSLDIFYKDKRSLNLIFQVLLSTSILSVVFI